MKKIALSVIVTATIILVLLISYFALHSGPDTKEVEMYSLEPPGFGYNGIIATYKFNFSTNGSEMMDFLLRNGFTNVTLSPGHSYYDMRDCTYGDGYFSPFNQVIFSFKHTVWVDPSDLTVLNENVTVNEIGMTITSNYSGIQKYYQNYSDAYDYNLESAGSWYNYEFGHVDVIFDLVWEDFYQTFQPEFIDVEFEPWIVYYDVNPSTP